MNNELSGELYGMYRVDKKTVSVAFVGKMINVLDKNISWQTLESSSGLDLNDPLKNTLDNDKIMVVTEVITLDIDDQNIILKGSKENIRQAIKTIGYN